MATTTNSKGPACDFPVAVSPTSFPISAAPIGDSLLILFLNISVSVGPTIL
jgi:hypothetical protein